MTGAITIPIVLRTKVEQNASGWLSAHQNIFINLDLLEFLSEIKTPSVIQRADKLLIELERRTEVIGDLIDIPNQVP